MAGRQRAQESNLCKRQAGEYCGIVVMKEGTDKILNSKSKTFLAFCFCFILGVGLFSSLELAEYWLFRLYILLFIISFY